MTDFTMRSGTDYTIKCVVTGYMNAFPVDVDTPATIEVVFWKSGGSALIPARIKDTDDVSVTTNPLSDNATLCCINIPVLEADAEFFEIGTYRYEVAVTKSSKRQVVYPLDGAVAMFEITSSDTWKEEADIEWPEPT
jgi:hypothetical protein